MSAKQVGKAKPLKQPKVDKKEYDEAMNRVWQTLAAITKVVEHNLAAENSRQASASTDRVEQFLKFRKLSPPSFNGSDDPLEADDWIRSLKKLFNILECTDEQRVAFAIFMLKDAAYDWWRFTRPDADEDDNLTWEEFMELFYQRYFPESVRRQKVWEFIRLVQGGLSVTQYSDKFNQLARFSEHIVPDNYQKARKFEEGLRSQIRSRISPLLLKSYSDVLERALIVESDCEEHQRRKRARMVFVENNNRACFNCGMNDHLVRDCPFQNDRRESVSVDLSGRVDS